MEVTEPIVSNDPPVELHPELTADVATADQEQVATAVKDSTVALVVSPPDIATDVLTVKPPQTDDTRDFEVPKVSVPTADTDLLATIPTTPASHDILRTEMLETTDANLVIADSAQPVNQEDSLADEDDDFGDFDDFTAATPLPVMPTLSESTLPSTAIKPNPPTTTLQFTDALQAPLEEARISSIMESLQVTSSLSNPELTDMLDIIRRAWGTVDLSNHSSASITFPQCQSLTENDTGMSKLSPTSIQKDRLWMLLANDTSTSVSSREAFRWHKSQIRTQFIGAVNGGLPRKQNDKSNVQPNQTGVENSLTGTPSASLRSGPSESQPPIASASSTTGPTFASMAASSGGEVSMVSGFAKPPPNVYDQLDPREADLLEAKRLCDLSEDEIRRHSTEDIRELIKSLMDHHVKMQEQANHWLDSKEQLVMDAEMHNKMIASLVQYAQQQQVTPKVSTGTTKKKRFGALSLK
ncbi:hypothetical protein BASA81_015720 [Batrachochytrium salamandrivorans]|nr:hypothetical protein BASA81_015720 [Batrachochytrium salamandrivorans]